MDESQDAGVLAFEENDEAGYFATIVALQKNNEAVVEVAGEKSNIVDVTYGPSANTKHSDVCNVDETEDGSVLTLEENNEGGVIANIVGPKYTIEAVGELSAENPKEVEVDNGPTVNTLHSDVFYMDKGENAFFLVKLMVLLVKRIMKVVLTMIKIQFTFILTWKDMVSFSSYQAFIGRL